MQTIKNFGLITRGLGMAMVMAFAIQGNAATRDGTDGSGGVGKAKKLNFEAARTHIEKIKNAVSEHVTATALRSGADAGKAAADQAAHDTNNASREASATWATTAGTSLGAIGFETAATGAVHSVIGTDANKWTYFSALLSKLPAEKLEQFNSDATYRDALLNVVNKFGTIEVGGNKADDFASVVAGYDVPTLQSLANLRMQVAKSYAKTFKTFLNGSPSVALGQIKAHLVKTGMSKGEAATLVGAFQARFGDELQAFEHYEAAIRGNSPEALAIREAVYRAEAMEYLRNRGLSNEEAQQVVNSCGLKGAIA